jgi:hypothetical protein
MAFFNPFMVYLAMLLIAQAIQCQMDERLINKELERVRTEAFMA